MYVCVCVCNDYRDILFGKRIAIMLKLKNLKSTVKFRPLGDH